MAKFVVFTMAFLNTKNKIKAIFVSVDGCGQYRCFIYISKSEYIVRQSESHFIKTEKMKFAILLIGIATAGIPPSWTKRYDDFMGQFNGKGRRLGWFVESS